MATDALASVVAFLDAAALRGPCDDALREELERVQTHLQDMASSLRSLTEQCAIALSPDELAALLERRDALDARMRQLLPFKGEDDASIKIDGATAADGDHHRHAMALPKPAAPSALSALEAFTLRADTCHAIAQYAFEQVYPPSSEFVQRLSMRLVDLLDEMTAWPSSVVTSDAFSPRLMRLGATAHVVALLGECGCRAVTSDMLQAMQTLLGAVERVRTSHPCLASAFARSVATLTAFVALDTNESPAHRCCRYMEHLERVSRDVRAAHLLDMVEMLMELLSSDVATWSDERIHDTAASLEAFFRRWIEDEAHAKSGTWLDVSKLMRKIKLLSKASPAFEAQMQSCCRHYAAYLQPDKGTNPATDTLLLVPPPAAAPQPEPSPAKQSQ